MDRRARKNNRLPLPENVEELWGDLFVNLMNKFNYNISVVNAELNIVSIILVVNNLLNFQGEKIIIIFISDTFILYI